MPNVVESKLSIFLKKAVGFLQVTSVARNLASATRCISSLRGGRRRMRWLGLLRQPSFLKNHFEIKLNAIKLTKVPGEPGRESLR